MRYLHYKRDCLQFQRARGRRPKGEAFEGFLERELRPYRLHLLIVDSLLTEDTEFGRPGREREDKRQCMRWRVFSFELRIIIKKINT